MNFILKNGIIIKKKTKELFPKKSILYHSVIHLELLPAFHRSSHWALDLYLDLVACIVLWLETWKLNEEVT